MIIFVLRKNRKHFLDKKIQYLHKNIFKRFFLMQCLPVNLFWYQPKKHDKNLYYIDSLLVTIVCNVIKTLNFPNRKQSLSLKYKQNKNQRIFNKLLIK